MKERIDVNGKRYYVVTTDTKTLRLPSVTTILGRMTDQSGLDAWKKRIGETEAEAVSKFAANRRTVMHELNESFLKTLDSGLTKEQRLKLALRHTYKFAEQENFSPAEVQAARKLFYNFYVSGTFDKVRGIILQETMLYSTVAGGYAGTVDKVYVDTDGHIVIADYKSSKKAKSEKYIDNYKMQISAYYIAYYTMFGKKPHRCEIWISNDIDTEPQIFTLSEADVKEWFYKFSKLVEAYHKIYDEELTMYEQSINI